MKQIQLDAEVLSSYVNTQELPWVDFHEGHQIKVCKLNPVTGQMILFIKSEPGSFLPVHFHSGTVIVYTVQGEWTYGEGWTAKPGDVIYEIAGSTHSPKMVGQEDTIVFLIIEGVLEYQDEDGNKIGFDNWQTLQKRYLDFCEQQGLTPVDLTKF